MRYSRVVGAAIERVLDVRPGEGRVLAATGGALAALIAAHTLVETARDALFLGKMPAHQLAWVYAGLAAIAFVVVPWGQRFARLFGHRNALVVSLMGTSFGTTLLHLAPKTGPVVFGLYLWSGLVGAVLVSQFWLLAGGLFTVAQGKRLFGPLAAGGVLGAVAGAGAANVALTLRPVEDLLLAASALFLVAATVLTIVPGDEAPIAPTAEAPAPRARLRDALHGEPYLTRIALLVVTSTAAVLTADYLFKATAARSLSPEALGPFFARTYAVLNTIALIVQVGMASRIVRRVGVLGAAGLLPSLLAVASGASLLLGAPLAAVLATKGADGALRHSLHRVATELVWLPLPASVRERAKAPFDAVLSRLAQAGTAGLLLGLAALGLDGGRPLSALILGLSVAWLAVTWSMRRPYLDLFRKSLSQDEGELGRIELDLASVEVAIEALSSVDDNRVVGAMDLLGENGRARLIPALILHHQSEPVLLRALHWVATPDRRDWIPLTRRLLEHASDPVRVAAIRAVARAGRPEDREALEARLGDISPGVRAHATYALLDRAADPTADPRVEALLSIGGQAGVRARVALLEAIRDTADRRWVPIVDRCAHGELPLVREAAARAIAAVPDPRFIEPLIARLRHRHGRDAIRAALVAIGPAAMDALLAALDAPGTPMPVKIHIPRSVSRFGNQAAADALVRMLGAPLYGVIRYKALRGLGRLVADGDVRVEAAPIEAALRVTLTERLRLGAISAQLRRLDAETAPPDDAASLLIALVADKQKQALERASRLLQIRHRHEDLLGVYAAITSDDRRRRASAQEFLDALTLRSAPPDGPVNRAMLALLLDELDDAERARRASAWLPRPPVSPAAALRSLVVDADPHVRSLATEAARARGIPATAPSVVPTPELVEAGLLNLDVAGASGG